MNNMVMSRKLAIVTPSWNYGRFIEDALASVRHQESDSEIEHIVMDAGSTDNTRQILQQQPEHVRWQSEPDAGQSDALNKALELVSHEVEWIGWLNADEFYLPGAFEAFLEFSTADADVIYGDAIFVDERGRFERSLPQHPFSQLALRHHGCYIATCATFLRRSVLEDEPFDRRLKRIMDWDLWLSLAEQGAQFSYLPRPLGAFRLHGRQVTADWDDTAREEHRLVRSLHGLSRPNSFQAQVQRISGQALHGLLKLASGSYQKQWRATRVSGGRDVRWWDNRSALSSCIEIVNL